MTAYLRGGLRSVSGLGVVLVAFVEHELTVPEDERTGVHLCRREKSATESKLEQRSTTYVGGTLIIPLWVPPTSDDDLVARENDAFISPLSSIHVAVVILEELHHGQTLPAGDSVLVRQRVDPTACFEVPRSS